MSSPSAAVRDLYAALEAGRAGEDLRDLLTPDAVVVEHPNLIAPAGRSHGREAMLAGAAAGAQLLARQSYQVRSVVEQGDLVVARLTWNGVVRNATGALSAGQTLTAHIAQFVRVRQGRIAAIETYDCYEPFA